MRRHLHFVASLVVGFVAFSPALAADSPSPLPRGGDNPALERFARQMALYVGFDGHALAEITTGDPRPAGNTNWTGALKRSEPVYESGISGRSLVSRDYQLNYLCTGAVLRASGTVALWMKPAALHHAGTYCWPVMLHASAGYSVMFGRMGDPANREALYAHLAHGKTGVSAIAGSMARWTPGTWHLFVVTWDRNAVEFSVDGALPARTVLKAPIPSDQAAGFRLFLLSPGDDTFAYDELLVLNVPLNKDEIRWLYEQGTRTDKGAQE